MLVLFLTASLAGTAWPAGEQLRLEMTADAMGSSYAVVVYGTDRMKMQQAVEAAFEEVHRLDNLLSNYRPSSEWSEINRDGGQRPVRVSREVFDLISACLDFSRRSEGAFDITVGPLMKLWGFYKGSGRLPHRAEVRAVLGRLGYRHILLDPKEQTVRFDRKGVEIDPGGIGKGYAVDRMVETLKQYGITSALISGSASSIYGLGAPPTEPRGWKIEIRDPKVRTRHVTTIYLKDQSLSTSGSYEKFFRAQGRVYSHIMDPRTGYPAQGMLEVSILAPRTLDSEAWTKPVFVNGRAWAAQHLPRQYRAFICEDRTEQPCAWLQ